MNQPLSDIHGCYVVDLNRIQSPQGNLTVIQNGDTLPFDVRRVYYLYDIPGGTERGGHAHKKLFQLIIAASGSFDVILDDGRTKKIIQLNRPYFALMVVQGIWREIVNFSSGAICLVLASDKYSNEDYIRDYNEYIQWRSSK